MGGGRGDGESPGTPWCCSHAGAAGDPPPSTAELSVPPHLHLLLIQDLHEAVILLLVVAHGGGEGAAAQHHGALSLTEVFLLGGIKLDGVRGGGGAAHSSGPTAEQWARGCQSPPLSSAHQQVGRRAGPRHAGLLPRRPLHCRHPAAVPRPLRLLKHGPLLQEKGKGGGGGALGLIATL